MADIGAEVGIAASAIYWHFPSKQALLVSVFDECLERLGRAQDEAVEQSSDSEDALRRLVDQHVDFVVVERDLARVYYQESVHLPEEDQRRLRRKQAAMVAAWTDLLCSCREGLEREYARAMVGAAIGAVQSALRSRDGMGRDLQRQLLAEAAWRVLRP
ncbi:TetR/AcrR family transcriptional regulator [Citricoccus parietis]